MSVSRPSKRRRKGPNRSHTPVGSPGQPSAVWQPPLRLRGQRPGRRARSTRAQGRGGGRRGASTLEGDYVPAPTQRTESNDQGGSTCSSPAPRRTPWRRASRRRAEPGLSSRRIPSARDSRSRTVLPARPGWSCTSTMMQCRRLRCTTFKAYRVAASKSRCSSSTGTGTLQTVKWTPDEKRQDIVLVVHAKHPRLCAGPIASATRSRTSDVADRQHSDGGGLTHAR